MNSGVSVTSNVIQLANWYRIPLRHPQGIRLRDYELPYEEYRFLQKVRTRLGGKLGQSTVALQSLLVGEIGTIDISSGDRKIIEETAKEMRIVLPK